MICTAWAADPNAKYPDCWTWGDEQPPTEFRSSLPPPAPDEGPVYDVPLNERQKAQGAKAVKRAIAEGRMLPTVEGHIPLQKMVPLHRWDADHRDTALAYFRRLQKDGLPHTNGKLAHAPSRVWRYRGSPDYLEQQIQRLRLPASIKKRAQTNKEVCQASTLLGQLSERLIKCASNNGENISMTPQERADINAAIDEGERFVAILVCATAGMAQALDEARAAYKLPPKQRDFEIISVYDQPAESNGKSH